MTRLLILIVAAFVFTAPAFAEDWPQSAETFIADIGDEALNSIAKKETKPEKARAAFADLFRRVFDVPTIARFTLGRYWHKADAAQREEYTKLLEETILDLYAARLKDYAGTPFTITGSRLTTRDDAIVGMAITLDGAGQPLKIDWRVRKRGETQKVIDVMVEGVSMSLTNRQEFAAIIQRGGGDVEALLKAMREKKL